MSVMDTALAQIKLLNAYSPGKPVEELERELGIREAIKLASNENPLGCSPLAQKAIESASRNIELYPDANAYYLKQQLAAKLSLKTEQITIGNGSNDVLDLVARIFLDAQSEAIFSEFAFLVYPLVVQACGAKARVARALPAGDRQAYGHDLNAMLALINDKTRLIFVANPNNPTGSWLHRDQLRDFIDRVPDHIAVVIDEAYFEYVEEDDYPDSLEWISSHANLIVTRTFSKIYGLAGLRVGYAIASPEISDLLNRLRQPFNANGLGLAAATASLQDAEFVNASRRNNRQGLQQLAQYFEARGIETIPSVANFITVKFGPKCDAIYQALLRQGIILRPLANYNLPEFLRITIGTPEQREALMRKLDHLL